MYLIASLIPLVGCSYSVKGLWDDPVVKSTDHQEFVLKNKSLDATVENGSGWSSNPGMEKV
jgi:hypothetical protein